MQNDYLIKNNNVIASPVQSSEPVNNNPKIYNLKTFSIGLIIFTASSFIAFTYFQFFNKSHRNGVILDKNPHNNLNYFNNIDLFIM
jgi:uncharacterized membrane protein YukC